MNQLFVPEQINTSQTSKNNKNLKQIHADYTQKTTQEDHQTNQNQLCGQQSLLNVDKITSDKITSEETIKSEHKSKGQDQLKNIQGPKEVQQQEMSSDEDKTKQFQFEIFKKTSANLGQNDMSLQKPLIQIDKTHQNQKELQNQSKMLQGKQQKYKARQMQKKVEIKNEMTSSINQNQKVQSRRIPDKLFQSYEQVILPKTQNKKSDKKQKKNQKSTLFREQQNKYSLQIDEQMLASLPTIQGFCSIKLQNSNPKQAKYVIIKQTILFPQLKKIYIRAIKKIKILQKNDQYFIKICAQKSPKQDQVILLTVFANQNAKFAIFYRTFQFFSNILLRKMILKSILINQNTQKFQKNQPLQFQSSLFKKQHFFSSWQRRKMKLQNNILSTYKGDKCSSQIKCIRQLWTRFDMMNGYLIVKTWHGYEKNQLGIPLCDFTVIDGRTNWLYGLIRMIKQKQDQN